MPPENNPAGSTEEWMRYAKSDLELARSEPPPSVLLEAFCFHAQQAAEKALKAVLISKNLLFPRTHNIGALFDLLEEHIPVPEDIQEATRLTNYAVNTRYPRAPESVDETELNETIRLAESVVLWAERTIGQ